MLNGANIDPAVVDGHMPELSGTEAFLHKPFTSADVDQVLHAAFGLRSPNLKVSGSGPSFEVAIDGSTIRLAHKPSGHVFE